MWRYPRVMCPRAVRLRLLEPAGRFGGDDLYRAAVTGDSFGPAQHLRTEANAGGDEWSLAPSPDGTALMFASNKPGAKHDLFVARVLGDGFAPAEPLTAALGVTC